MNDGWLAEMRIYREDTTLGDKVGDTIRPAGLRGAVINARALGRFARVDAWGHTSGGRTLHGFHTLSWTREFNLDGTTEMLLEAMRSDSPTAVVTGGFSTTTKGTASALGIPSFGASVKLVDGRFYRLRGMTPTKIEWVIQGRRAIIEEATFAVLRIDQDTGLDAAVEQPGHRITAAHHARHALSLSGLSWPDPTADVLPTFQSQLIFTRDASPVQYDPLGRPTRYEITGHWELVGKTEMRRIPGLSELTTGRTAKMWWEIASPADTEEALTIRADRAWMRLNQQPVLGKGQIDTSVDFMAAENGAFTATLRRRL